MQLVAHAWPAFQLPAPLLVPDMSLRDAVGIAADGAPHEGAWLLRTQSRRARRQQHLPAFAAAPPDLAAQPAGTPGAELHPDTGLSVPYADPNTSFLPHERGPSKQGMTSDFKVEKNMNEIMGL